MQRNNSVVSWLIAVSLVLVLTAGIASAATETNKISFSGNLTSSVGTPLTGTYTVTFRLYNVASGGTALATDTHTVTAAKGLYTTTLNFPASNYNGQQLYVGIQRSPDAEKSPRTVLYPVSYALSLRPGAVVSGSTSTSPVLRLAKSDNNGMGLYASTSGTSSDAILGIATNYYSHGVHGESSEAAGVYGKGLVGGYFTTNRAGSMSAYIFPDALQAVTSYDYTTGVNVVSTSKILGTGVSVYTTGSQSEGVYVTTEGLNSHGIHSITQNAGSNAVVGETYSNAAAVAGIAHNKSSSPNYAYGLYGVTDRTDGKYGIYTPNYLYAKGTQVPATDVAEYMPVNGDLAPGTVVIIGEDGKLQKSSSAYDTKVAGIISTDPGVTLGTKEGGNPGESQIAVAGRVPCMVDASRVPIHAGDLLTTSDNPGYAMKATDPKIGTVLGKSMGSLESGTGTIEVLVTLQ